ncbi:MAG: glycerol-3-phosphate dehydrogenase [Candidatus Marinimicrobia bacterium]|nr:glycerol-3-phosphate dehydrogenase [Candidatus Neomarinimicrobiota bacterium]
MNRAKQLTEITSAEYDVAIIGGGINGAGIAMDLALRGVKTILFEKRDFGWYATSSSTKLIHGGLRYLEYFELSLVRESLAERERLLSNAPHLVKPLKLNVPIYKHSKRPAWMVRAGLTLYDILSYNKSLPNHSYYANNRKQRERATIDPALNQKELTAVLSYYDCQIAFPERLTLELIIGAEEAGAAVLNYCKVKGMSRDSENENYLLQVNDKLTETNHEIAAKYIINAGGPFVDSINLNLAQEVGRKMGGTKGSHLLIKRFEGGPKEAIYVEAQQDGRPYFIIPWLDYYLVGTTDLFYDGDMNEVHATKTEIEYLLYELNQLIPGHSFEEKDVLYTYSGIRPLPFEPGKKERSVTRRHIILDHEKAGGSQNAFSIIGGKLTTYRSLAEDTADLICKRLGHKAACVTRHQSLPGAIISDKIQKVILSLANRHQISDATVQHLLSFYGSRTKEILEQVGKEPELATLISDDRPEIMAEVAYAIRSEHAQTLADIYYRRTIIGSYADRSENSVNNVAALAAEYLAWSPSETRSQIESLALMMSEQSHWEAIPA